MAKNIAAASKERSIEEQASAFARGERRTTSRRRALAAELLAAGHDVDNIARLLRTTPAAIHADLAVLRRLAAERQLATDPGSCAPLFLEDALAVLQKVRAAQHALPETDSTLYLNLLKLEWAMLIKLVEMTTAPAGKGTADSDDDDLAALSDDELLDRARDLGIDTTGFERALRSARPNAA